MCVAITTSSNEESLLAVDYHWGIVTGKHKHVQRIQGLPIVNGRLQSQKELLVAAPRRLLDPKNSQASGHKLNETLRCILSQHWFPESLYEQNSMAAPLIKHPQHVQQSSGGFLLITTGTAGNSELIVLSASLTELLWLHPPAAREEAITQSHINFMLIVHFQMKIEKASTAGKCYMFASSLAEHCDGLGNLGTLMFGEPRRQRC